MSAVFQAAGIHAQPSPASDSSTLELSAKYLNGDECLPERVTLGDFLKVIDDPGFDPARTAFLLPTSGGPCRFGQYQAVLKKILRERGYEQALVISPTSANGYEGFGEAARALIRTSWHALLASDCLRKLHLKIRPYVVNRNLADELFHQSLDELSSILATQGLRPRHCLRQLRQGLVRANKRYHSLSARFTKDKPLIGVVGEIFCRLNEFSHNYLINKIEALGGEIWISDIAEWLWYTNDEQRWRLIRAGKRYSSDMLAAKIKFAIQRHDEHYLLQPLRAEFEGYEEPHDIRQVLAYSSPYLPQNGALGEMVLNVGKAIYLYHHGADGVIDISPFTCMNGIVCETVYPQVSKACANFPIRLFYFDGTSFDLDRDIEIFLDLARNYMQQKKIQRRYPYYFR
ncbi:MAG: hypothetical protein ONB16_08780 [candidate division KSB1 bacterium]|nr:hypothetical protein [candidate division KSB1 bacterium]MDZ7340123.1 hypothetical protein [candidate division KSB1 bacterium]